MFSPPNLLPQLFNNYLPHSDSKNLSELAKAMVESGNASEGDWLSLITEAGAKRNKKATLDIAEILVTVDIKDKAIWNKVTETIAKFDSETRIPLFQQMVDLLIEKKVDSKRVWGALMDGVGKSDYVTRYELNIEILRNLIQSDIEISNIPESFQKSFLKELKDLSEDQAWYVFSKAMEDSALISNSPDKCEKASIFFSPLLENLKTSDLYQSELIDLMICKFDVIKKLFLNENPNVDSDIDFIDDDYNDNTFDDRFENVKPNRNDTEWRKEHAEKLKSATVLARECLESTLNLLNTHGDKKEVRSLFRKWMGDHGKKEEDKIDKIKSRIKKTLELIDKLTINKFKSGKKENNNTKAYVNPFNTWQHKIFIEKSGMDESVDELAMTLIHELSHFKDIGKTDDHWYDELSTPGYKNKDKSAKLGITNADSYSHFAYAGYALMKIQKFLGIKFKIPDIEID